MAKDSITHALAPLLFRHEQGTQTTLCSVWKKQLDSLETVEVVLALTEEYLFLYITCTEVKIFLRTCGGSQDTLQLLGKKVGESACVI